MSPRSAWKGRSGGIRLADLCEGDPAVRIAEGRVFASVFCRDRAEEVWS